MPENWVHLSVRPTDEAGRRAVLRAVEEHERLDHDATVDGELVIAGHHSDVKTKEFLSGLGEHVDQAVMLWEQDDGVWVWGGFFEGRDGDLEEVDEVWTTERALAVDVVTAAGDVHGPV